MSICSFLYLYIYCICICICIYLSRVNCIFYFYIRFYITSNIYEFYNNGIKLAATFLLFSGLFGSYFQKLGTCSSGTCLYSHRFLYFKLKILIFRIMFISMVTPNKEYCHRIFAMILLNLTLDHRFTRRGS